MPQRWEKHYPKGVRWDCEIPAGTLPGLIARSAKKFGERTIIDFRGREMSFADLAARIDLAAAAFLRAGYGKGHSVALFLGNTPDHPVNFFGATKAGARIVHLSPLDGEIALTHKLTDSGARVLVTSNLAPMLAAALKFLERGLVDRIVVCEDERWGESANPLLPLPSRKDVVAFGRFIDGVTLPESWPVVTPDDVAALQYTGGTTGMPKGAMLTHGNLMAGSAIYDAWGAASRAERGDAIDKVICVLPLFHIFALITVLLRQIDRGNVILLHQRFDVEAVLRDIEVKRATAFPGVPTMWIAIANTPGLEKRDFSSLLFAGSGGAPLPVEVARVLGEKIGLSLKGGWGMTETCSAGTAHPKEGPDKPASIGLPLPGIDMDIVSLDDPASVLPVGEVGEIRVKGPNVTKGYWNKPDESAASYVDGRFLTGDVGYMDEDGYFFIVDRKKDMIISGGFNVYPQMIEQAIYQHPAVQEVIVIGVPDAYRGEAAKAFVKLRNGAERFTLEGLRGFLAGKVGKHELPAELEFRDELPRTTVGKLSRHELRVQGSRQEFKVKSGLKGKENTMDLSYSKEEVAFREEVRDFFRTAVPAETRRKLQEGRHLSKEDMVTWQRILNKKGWAVPHWPKQWGGTGWDAVKLYIFNEEMQLAPAPQPLAFGVNMLGPVLFNVASEEQKKHYLPRIANLDDWWCQGFSEPGAGSDLASLKTKAERKGDVYVVNGQKTWTTLAQHADWIFCLVRTDPNAKNRQSGISFLLVDMKSPGITVRPIITIDGGHEVNEVFFDNVEVPVANLVGEENKGWDYGKFLLGNERTGIARIGASKERLRRIRQLASQVQSGGKPIIEDQRFLEKLTAVEIELKALEMNQMRVVAGEKHREKGKPDPASSILKIKGSELQQATTELMMDVIGPFAAPSEAGDNDGSNELDDWTTMIAPNYFNYRKVTIYGGSNEIQRNIIAKAVLGL